MKQELTKFGTIAMVVVLAIAGWFGGDFMDWILLLPQDSFWRGVLTHAAGMLLIALPLFVLSRFAEWCIKKARGKKAVETHGNASPE